MTIEQEIAAWAAGRPAWQQSVLRQLAHGRSFSQEEIETLARELKVGSQPKAVKLKPEDIPGAKTAGATLRLCSVRETANVNALVDSQQLSFAPNGLTVVYGDNGSGKSGYARVIKDVAQARHHEPVHQNVFAANTGAQRAEIEFQADGAIKTSTWPGHVSGELRAIGFYDEACGDAYIGGESELTYRPPALAMLDDLIAVCDEVRAVLDQDLHENQLRRTTLPAVVEQTSAASFLRTLSGSITEQAVTEACAVPNDADQQLGDLLQEEARLRASDPTAERTRLEAAAARIERVSEYVAAIADALSAERVEKSLTLRTRAIELRAAANIASSRSFESEPLSGVGSQTWRALWEAARAFSQAETYPAVAFPATGDGARCVLCHQELSDEAADRLTRFQAFMKDTTAQQADEAERTLAQTVASYRALESTPAEFTAALVALEGSDPEPAEAVSHWLADAAARRRAVVDRLEGSSEVEPSELSDSPRRALDARVTELRQQAAAIDASQFQMVLAEVTQRRNDLQSRLALLAGREAITAEISRLAERHKIEAAKHLTDTAPITRKATELTEEHVTALVRDRFTRESDRLRLERIELKRTGGHKGKYRHRPALLGAKLPQPVEEVLSEGEQTALGLAGYFTEAHFEDTKSTLVLDDPVTSLDHIRRARVARRLAEFGGNRQVIVFTHDVAFVGDLRRCADEQQVGFAERGVQRRGDNLPGLCNETHPWKAKDVGTRLQQLEQDLARIKRQRGTWDQETYEKECSDWAGKLSETWERLINLEIVYMVVDPGTSEVRPKMFKVLARITEDDDREFQQSYGRISAWVRRHDKSPTTNYVAPEPSEFEQELKGVRAWFDRIKTYRKST